MLRKEQHGRNIGVLFRVGLALCIAGGISLPTRAFAADAESPDAAYTQTGEGAVETEAPNAEGYSDNDASSEGQADQTTTDQNQIVVDESATVTNGESGDGGTDDAVNDTENADDATSQTTSGQDEASEDATVPSPDPTETNDGAVSDETVSDGADDQDGAEQVTGASDTENVSQEGATEEETAEEDSEEEVPAEEGSAEEGSAEEGSAEETSEGEIPAEPASGAAAEGATQEADATSEAKPAQAPAAETTVSTTATATATATAAKAATATVAKATTATTANAAAATVTSTAKTSKTSVATKSTKTTAKSVTKETPKTWSLVNGIYVIESSLKDFLVACISGGTTKTSSYKNDVLQKWLIRRGTESEMYYISPYQKRYKFLYISGNKLLLTTDKSQAQQWRIKTNENNSLSYILAPSGKKALGIEGSKTTPRASILLMSAVQGSGNQLFYVLPMTPNVVGEKTIEDGAYSVSLRARMSQAVSVAKASKRHNANMVATKNQTLPSQRLFFQYDGEGFYTIGVVSSGKVLTISRSGVVGKQNIVQRNNKGADTQKWAVSKYGKGYLLTNKATGLTLNLSGSNINAAHKSGKGYQIANLKKVDVIDPGIYEVLSHKNTKKAVEIQGCRAWSNAKVQLNADKNSLAQRYEIVRVGGTGSNVYRIRTAASGGWLTISSVKEGAAIKQMGNSRTAVLEKNSWKVVWNGGYWSLQNVASGKVLDLQSGSVTNGTRVVAKKANGNTAQHFTFNKASLINDGYYLLSIKDGKYLDISAGSQNSGANVVASKKTGGMRQTFKVYRVGSSYQLRNMNSGKLVAVAKNTTKNGANVTQRTKRNLSNQLWDIKIADGGGLVFVNAASGKALTVAGSNVRQNNVVAGNSAQSWQLTPTKPKGWSPTDKSEEYTFFFNNGTSHTYQSRVYRAWKQIKTFTSKTKYIITIDNDLCRVCVFVGSANRWEPLKDWTCCVGMFPGPDEYYGITPRGKDEIIRKGYMMGSGTVEYWWSEFHQDWNSSCRFHSAVYVEGTMNLVDGTMGAAVSHGCVRLPYGAAKWIYDNCPIGTATFSFPKYNGGRFPANNSYSFKYVIEAEQRRAAERAAAGA